MARKKYDRKWFKVATYREAGLEAKWSKTRDGCPCIFLRNPNGRFPHQRTTWWMRDRAMLDAMIEDGDIVSGFDRCTVTGAFFSVPA